MDQELREYLERWFVRLEGVREELRVIARGVMNVSERLEAFQVDTTRNVEEIRKRVAPGDQITISQPKDLNEEIRHLDRRIKWLEARAQRQDMDAIESLRAKLGPLQP